MPAFMFTAPPENVSLSYLALPETRRVRVIGDFNGWEAPGTPMVQSSSKSPWKLSLRLDPGVYRYVFLENAATVPVGPEFRRRVQVLVLAPLDYKNMPALRGDGLITPSGVLHQAAPRYVSMTNERTYKLTIRTRNNDVSAASVAVWSEGREQKVYPLKLQDSDPLFDYYSVNVVVRPAAPFLYRFLLDDGDGIRCYDASGLSGGVIGGTPFTVRPGQFKPRSSN